MAASEWQRQDALLRALLGRDLRPMTGSASTYPSDDTPDVAGAEAPAEGGGVSHDATQAAALHRLGLRGVRAAALPGREQESASTSDPSLEAGLQAYRGNAIALSARVLAGAFPHLETLLGPQFASLAWAFWRQCPPAGGDLGTWGAALPAFLRETADDMLAGVATFEWALHEAERAADATLDVGSLNHLHGDPAALCLAFKPGLALLELPLESLEALAGHRAWWTPSEQAGQEPTEASVGSTRGALPSALSGASSGASSGAADRTVASAVLVWRKDWRARATHLEAAAAAFMRSALAGHSLEAALAVSTGLPAGSASAPAGDTWDFTVFLQQALQEQWLTAVLPLAVADGAKETHDVHPDESSAPPGRHGLPPRD